MNSKEKVILILQTENKKLLSEFVEKYELHPAGSTDLLAQKPVTIYDQDKFVFDLELISNIQDFITELNDCGFDFRFEDIDTHEEVIF